MKIDRAEDEYRPITITLETKEDYDAMRLFLRAAARDDLIGQGSRDSAEKLNRDLEVAETWT